jgi:hypothetical protein
MLKEGVLIDSLPSRRRRLVRLDDGKANLVPTTDSARWFRLASVARFRPF